MNIPYRLHSGKNSNLAYYAGNFAGFLIPDEWFRMRLGSTLKKFQSRNDMEYILDRVNYYCKLNTVTPLPADSPALGEHRYGKRDYPSSYFFDTYMFTRWFPKTLHWHHDFGDVTYVPECPSIVKSRPLCDDNTNSVVMKLDRNRHFTFIKDHTPFDKKENRAIFRGDIAWKPRRQQFMRMYYGSPVVDAGDVTPAALADKLGFPAEWRRKPISLYNHLRYKFIMTLEGNDVASNLKWVMSSNSLAVMPRPTCETWFMEGRLIPGVHYVEIRPDFTDLEERMQYYIDHPAEADEIIRAAHEYVDQFRDKRREKLISLLVLNKYFEFTGQL